MTKVPGGMIDSSGDITITNLTVTGDLSVTGTTTSLETATLNVEDKNIVLNYGSGDTSASADGAGITIQDAIDAAADATFNWGASNDRFKLSHGLEVLTGRVGIGETAPDTFLHVKGTGSGGQGTIKMEGESAHLGFTKSDGNFRSWVGHYNSANHGSDSDLNIKTGYVGGSSSTGNIRISADGDTTIAQVYIEGSTGRVGIGTGVPATGTNLSHGLVVSDENSGNAADRRVTLKSVTHGQNAGFRFDCESADGTNKSGGLYFQPNNGNGSYIGLTGNDSSDHLLIDSNGYTTFVHTGGTDYGIQIRTQSTSNVARSGIVFDKPGTSTIQGSALLLRSDETYRLGTASNYHMIMKQDGRTIIGNSGDQAPAGTTFRTVINGHGTRALYVQSGTNGDAVSMWLGGGTTPQAAFDTISAGGAQIWSHESSSWAQITEYKHAYFKSLKDTYIGGNTWINGTGNYNNYNENIRLGYPANGVCVIAWGDTGGINGVTSGGTPRHSQLYFNSANSFRHRNQSGTAIYTLSSTGAASFASSVSQNTSDERLKENLEVIPNALTKVKGIRGVTFDWKDKTPDSKELDVPSSGHDVGVLAQEVQAVLPEAVSLAPFDTSGPDYLEEDVDYGIEEGTSITGENYLTVDYEKLVPLLIESIKQLSTELDAAKARITTLEG